MGKTLEKLEVVIEGSVGKFKQAINDAKKITSNFVKDTDEQFKKFKNIQMTVNDDETMQSIRNMQALIKKTFQDIKTGALPKEMANGIKDYVKQAQVAAGIKVYSEDYLKLVEDMKKAESEMDVLVKKAGSMQDSDIYEESKEYKELTKCISDTEKKLNSLIDKQDKMRALGVKESSQAWKSLQYDIESTKSSLAYDKGLKADMEEKGETKQHTKQWNDLMNTINQTSESVSYYRDEISKMKSEGSDVQFVGFKNIATSAASKALKGLESALKLEATAIKKCSGAFASLLQRFASGIPVIRRFTGGVKQNNNSLSSGLKNILKYAFGIRSLFVLMNRARRAVAEGLKNLAQYDGTTNQSISMLMSSLTQLKNAFATAFAPVLNIVAPILNTLIQLITKAVSAIGMLFATLTGQTTFVKATKVQQDYAASLNSSAGSAGAANDANKKLQKTLLGFDEINKLDDDSGSGSGGGGGGAGGLSPWDMFEEVPIDNNINAFAQKLKDAWEKADFTGIGQMIGFKLNGALESIPWDKIKGTSQRIAQSLATLLNGFIATADWPLVGKTIAEGINTAIEFGYTFVTTFNWNQLGSAISGSINGLFANINWAKAGQTVSRGISGVLEAILTIVQTTNWSQIGTSVGTFINNIDWGKIIETALSALLGLPKAVFEMVSGAVKTVNWSQIASDIGTGIKNAVTEFDWKGTFSGLGELVGSAIKMRIDLAKLIGEAIGDALDSVKQYFDEKADECGGDIWEGIKKGIKDAIKGIGTWIKENIFQPFIDGFKSAFGIASPSKEMKEQGGYIIDGLFEGLKDNIFKVLEWFGELPGKIKDAIGDAKDWLFDKGGDVVEGIKSGVTKGAVKVKEIGGKVASWVKEGCGNALEWVSDKGGDVVSGIVSGVNKGVSKVKETGGKVATWIKEGYEEHKDDIKNIAKKIPNFFSDGINGDIKNAGKSLMEKLNSSMKEKSNFKIPVSVSATASAIKKVQKSVTNIAKKCKLGVDADVSTKASDMKGKITDLIKGFTLDVNAKATLSEMKDNIRNKVLGAFTARLDNKNDNIKSKTLTSFNARLDDRTDNIKSKTLTSFNARMDDKTDNIKNKTLAAFIARMDSKSDNLRDRWFNTMGAIFEDKSDRIPKTKKNISDVTAKITSLTKGSGLSLSFSGILSGFKNIVSILFKRDGGIYKGGHWQPITAYAGGGAPNMGQMFVAREAGPELVGRIGSSTAVMNNDQIVASVSAGVYRAVMAALASYGNTDGNSTPVFNIYVGGKQVTDVVIEEVNNRTSSTGTCPILI